MKFSEMPYKRVNFEEIEVRFEKIMEEFQTAKSGEEQFAVHKKYYEWINEVYTNMTIAQIRHDVDTADEFYDVENNYCDEIMPKLNNLNVQYNKMMYESPYRKELEAIIGPVAFKNMELAMKSFDEKLIPLMQEENILKSAYDKLIASAKIDWEGETLNLSLLRRYTTSPNREVRAKAYKKQVDFFETNKTQLDDIYDKLVKKRTAQAKLMGYENYVTLGYYRMGRNCYDKNMVEKFRNQVKRDLVPYATKLHEARRVRLGVDKLMCYDEGVYFAEGNPEPIGTPEEILRKGQKMYSELSPETKEFYDFMMEWELFDVLGRKTKKAGGYMTYLPVYNAPFVFANFNGTSGDVDVITHECGHAFQGYLSGKDPIQEHRDITMETAEIHSMSMEFFTSPWMELFFENRADDYRTMQVEDAIMFIPYGCMVDEFQHIVYENPDMTPDERNEVWRKLENEYKPHLDYTGFDHYEAGGFWQKQPHIYTSPFYYIDYCLAQTCALEYKCKMNEDYKKAWESYLKLCKLSASGFFTDMIVEVGLDNPFEDGCVKDIVEKLV